MNDILFRIKYFIENKNISIRKFELSIGASNGLIGNAIKKNSDIQSKWISKIIEIYNINPTWLLTGEGPMLRSEIMDQELQKKNDMPPVTNSPPACPLCYEKERIIKEKERIIAAHEETIALLKEQLQEYRSKVKEGDTVFIAAKTSTPEPEPSKLK